ncbi:MAG TPA: hypothetical protein VJR30_15015 [Bradyrhizobium sp.]|nr:hypothetical protein [Bradyrhizobium sp.]
MNRAGRSTAQRATTNPWPQPDTINTNASNVADGVAVPAIVAQRAWCGR